MVRTVNDRSINLIEELGDLIVWIKSVSISAAEKHTMNISLTARLDQSGNGQQHPGLARQESSGHT